MHPLQLTVTEMDADRQLNIILPTCIAVEGVIAAPVCTSCQGAHWDERAAYLQRLHCRLSSQDHAEHTRVFGIYCAATIVNR